MGETDEGEYLEIDGTRFCRWRAERPPAIPNRLSMIASLQGGAIALAAYMVMACLASTLMSDPGFRDVLIEGLVSIPLLVPIVIVGVWEFRCFRSKPAPAEPARADNVPPEAIDVNCSVSGGGSRGRLYTDAGWLRFRGERFDFDVRLSDFERKKGAVKKLGRGSEVALSVPEEMSLQLSLFVGKGRREELVRMVERWAAHPEPVGGSLLPPMEDESEVPAAMEYLRELAAYAPIAAGCALGMALFILLAPKGLLPAHNTWQIGAVCGFGLPMTYALPGVFAIASLRRRYGRIRGRVLDGRSKHADDPWISL